MFMCLDASGLTRALTAIMWAAALLPFLRGTPLFSVNQHTETSDVASAEVKVHQPPVLRSRVGRRDTVALIVCVSIAGQSTTTRAQQLAQLQ